jgi:hypothetical protein
MAPRKRKTTSKTSARKTAAKGESAEAGRTDEGDPAPQEAARKETKPAAADKANAASALPADALVVGKSSKYEYLELKFGNRHGLVTGATGTGKTVSLQVMAEGFAKAGVPVFAADVKGDLSGIAAAGEAKDAFVTRARDMGLDYQPDRFATVFWDVFGEEGHPVRATIAEMGPLLLTRMMDLNDTQEGVLNIASALPTNSACRCWI